MRCAMYEMRQKKRRELRQKKWFSYALLVTAIFLFSQGSAIIKTNLQYALPLILISFILHTASVGNLTERIFKINSSIVANIAMIIALSIATIVCYFIEIGALFIILLNLIAIVIYVITALICSKLKTGEN